MEPVERQDAAMFGIEEMQVPGMAGFGHREHAEAVGAQDHVRGEVEIARAHGVLSRETQAATTALTGWVAPSNRARAVS
jgi:hypothetical protein